MSGGDHRSSAAKVASAALAKKVIGLRELGASINSVAEYLRITPTTVSNILWKANGKPRCCATNASRQWAEAMLCALVQERPHGDARCMAKGLVYADGSWWCRIHARERNVTK